METMPLDPSLPGVRQLQHWIREKRSVSIELPNGRMLERAIRWQDSGFIALRTKEGRDSVIVNHHALTLSRPLPWAVQRSPQSTGLP